MPEALYDMMWVAVHDERWDTTPGRKSERHWKKNQPTEFWRRLFEARRAWRLRHFGTMYPPALLLSGGRWYSGHRAADI
jgi:hypothetical protein